MTASDPTIGDEIVARPDDEAAAAARRLAQDTFGVTGAGVWAAPGRVNLLGEHVDYCGGPCLPVALPHRTAVALAPRTDDQVRLVSAHSPDDVWSGRLRDITPGGVTGWAAYAAGPAWALRQAGCAGGGFDAAIVSSVPVGAGLSSSAALECAVALALDETWGLKWARIGDRGRARLAAACVRAENEVAGAPTGGMDQAVSLRARAGHALLLDNRDASLQHLPLDLATAGLAVLVIDTRVRHALTDGAYAARRGACEAAAATLRVPQLTDVEDLPSALASLAGPGDARAWQRRAARHVVSEIARVRSAAQLLSAGQIAQLGPLLDASHESLRDDYAVSCPELDVAVEAARAAGALGARMTGGGFGGSALALVPSTQVSRVREEVVTAYERRGWQRPRFLLAVPSSGASAVCAGDQPRL